MKRLILVVIVLAFSMSCQTQHRERYDKVKADIAKYAENYCPTLAASTWSIGTIVGGILPDNEEDVAFVTEEVAYIGSGICDLLKNMEAAEE